MLFCKSMLKSYLNKRKQFCYPDTLGNEVLPIASLSTWQSKVEVMNITYLKGKCSGFLN